MIVRLGAPSSIPTTGRRPPRTTTWSRLPPLTPIVVRERVRMVLLRSERPPTDTLVSERPLDWPLVSDLLPERLPADWPELPESRIDAPPEPRSLLLAPLLLAPLLPAPLWLAPAPASGFCALA